MSGKLNLGGVIDRSAMFKERHGMTPIEYAKRHLLSDPTYCQLLDKRQKLEASMNLKRILHPDSFKIETIYTKEQKKAIDAIESVIDSHRNFIINSILETCR